MKKKILLTGATDGIGFETAKLLAESGNDLLIHGRNKEKLVEVTHTLKTLNPNISVSSYVADLSDLSNVTNMAKEILRSHILLPS